MVMYSEASGFSWPIVGFVFAGPSRRALLGIYRLDKAERLKVWAVARVTNVLPGISAWDRRVWFSDLGLGVVALSTLLLSC